MAKLEIDISKILNEAGCTQAVIDVLRERVRQVSEEGWTPQHDDQCHIEGELAGAAASYALSAFGVLPAIVTQFWPWSLGHWRPKGKRRDLVRAGALIIAEIERLDRLAASNG